MGQRETDRLADCHVQARGGGRPLDREIGGCGQQEPVGAAAGGQAPGDRFENGVDQAVFGPRGIGDLDVQLAVSAGEAAQQDPRRPGTKVVAAVVAADRQGVGQHRGTGRGSERGFQRHGLVHIGAGDLEVPSWADREVPTGGVQDAGEHGRRVEPGEA